MSKRKTRLVHVFQTIANIINGKAKQKFPGQYLVMELSPGARLILEGAEKDPSLVKIVSKVHLVNDIVTYSMATFTDEDYNLTVKEAKECADFWVSTTRPVAQPKAFSWPGEEGLTYCRLPWAPLVGGETPTWDRLFSRLHNSQALKAWIGSLFFAESYIHQYSWVFGQGNDGKGALNRFLANVFGMSYCSKQPPSPADRFWLYGLIGKRLVVFPDCNNQTFVSSGLFKSMTGGDPVDAERKGEMSITTRLAAKYLFFSNERPLLSSEKADERRIIYCEFESRGEDANDPHFEEKLWEEGGAFLGSCIDLYRKVAPDHGAVPTEKDKIDDWVETVEDEFAEALEFNFSVFSPDEKLDFIQPIELQRIVNTIFRDRKKQLNFYAWLERKHGIKKSSSNGTKRYKGLISKPLLHPALCNIRYRAGTGPATGPGKNITLVKET